MSSATVYYNAISGSRIPLGHLSRKQREQPGVAEINDSVFTLTDKTTNKTIISSPLSELRVTSPIYTGSTGAITLFPTDNTGKPGAVVIRG